MLFDDLRGVFLFEGLSDEQLHDLIAAGDEVHFQSGDVLFQEGEAADFWWVLVKGRVELLRRTRWEESVAGVMDRPGVWAGGFLAWADQAGYMATARGASPGVMLRVPAKALGDLARAWFPFGVHLIEGFFQTVRNMEALSRQREALAALGDVGREPAGGRRPRGGTRRLARVARGRRRVGHRPRPGGSGGRRCLVRARRPDPRRRNARTGPGMGGQHAVGGGAAVGGEGGNGPGFGTGGGDEVLRAAR